MKRRIANLLLAVYAVYVKEMKLWLRYPTWILTFIALPYMVTGLFSGVGYVIGGANAVQNFMENTGTSNFFLFSLVGSSLFMISTIIMEDVGNSIRSEQLRGTFELHYLTPTSTALIWTAHILPHSTISLITIAGTLIPVLALTEGLNPLSIAETFFILAVALVPLFGISLIIAALTVRFKEPWAVVQVIRALVSVASGFFYPIYILPEWLQMLSLALPTAHAVELIRAILVYMREFILSDYRFSLLVVLSLAYLIVGLKVFGRWEDHARKTGNLSKY